METVREMENEPVILMGGFTIQEARALKDLFAARLLADRTLTLDLSKVNAFDAAGLQLLCALHRTAQSQGGDIHLLSPLPECLELAIQAAGFSRHCNCSLDRNNSCLWSRGEKL